jgi:PPOX class probable F420-dependent enzyme
MNSVPDSHRDLVDANIGTLATTDGDGRPQLSPVWFLFEDGTLRISLNAARQKTKNLERNAACSFLILDLSNPYRYLELRGVAQIEPDPDFAFAAKVGTKYDINPTAFDQPGEARVIVTIETSKVIAVDMSG